MPNEGYEIHEVYLVKHDKEIEAGNPIVCELMPLATYSRILVRAHVSRSYDARPGMEQLWVREDDGTLQGRPWAIHILEELDPDEVAFEPEARSTLELKS